MSAELEKPRNLKCVILSEVSNGIEPFMILFDDLLRGKHYLKFERHEI